MRASSTLPTGLIVGISGTSLQPDEQVFLQKYHPLGVILFGRNIENPKQVHSLCIELKRALGHANALIFIDQEGGRVQRLKPPHWPHYASGRIFGQIAQTNLKLGLRAAYLTNRLIADDLHQLGINADCTPVLDLEFPETHDVIGDRAYGESVDLVAQMGAVVIKAMLEGAVAPVIKHIPGHGRATADSHLELPKVDVSLADLYALDFAPFIANAKQCPFAMTAHITYTALDSHHPATQSKIIMQQIIRNIIGYKGLVMTDDLSMQALTGSYQERAQLSLDAGCDILLHCNGKMDEMEAIASVAQIFNTQQMMVLHRWMQKILTAPKIFNRIAAEKALERILEK